MFLQKLVSDRNTHVSGISNQSQQNDNNAKSNLCSFHLINQEMFILKDPVMFLCWCVIYICKTEYDWFISNNPFLAPPGVLIYTHWVQKTDAQTWYLARTSKPAIFQGAKKKSENNAIYQHTSRQRQLSLFPAKANMKSLTFYLLDFFSSTWFLKQSSFYQSFFSNQHPLGWPLFR